MKEFNLFVDSELEKTAVITVNGQTANFVQANGGAKVFNFVTEDEIAEVTVTRKHELLTPLWFLWGMFYFIIGVFGIFDVSYGKKLPINSKFTMRLNGSTSALQLTSAGNKDAFGVKAAASVCSAEAEQNESYYKVIKKRRKILIGVKIVLWIAAIAIGVAMMIVK